MPMEVWHGKKITPQSQSNHEVDSPLPLKLKVQAALLSSPLCAPWTNFRICLCCRIHGAKVKETRTYHFDIWKMELSRVKHYMQVEPSGQLKNPNTPSNVTHEVAMTLDVEIFRQVCSRTNVRFGAR